MPVASYLCKCLQSEVSNLMMDYVAEIKIQASGSLFLSSEFDKFTFPFQDKQMEPYKNIL